MNSKSKCYHDDDCKKQKEHCPTILKCGYPNSTTIITVPLNTPTPFTVATLTLNTPRLCNSNILLEFTSNIVIDDLGEFIGTISFQVFKRCNNLSVPVGSGWTFSSTMALATTFSFFVCDSNCCNDECCTYTVVATINASSFPVDTIYINNATLSALVGSSDCSC